MSCLLLILIFALYIVFSQNANVPNQDDTVNIITTTGEIVGKVSKVSIQTGQENETSFVSTFYGIPFARPPIGKLRFKPPMEADPWVGQRLAFEQPKSCWQIVPKELNITGMGNLDLSEDCLYLNVWVPNPVREKTAVMVYVYGGAFSMGSVSLFPYSAFVAKQKVIVVAMNYRLSSLGFLYLGTEDCPGNLGLWDQQMALKWVRENIERFGGDPDRVTLFGQSAGSVSVGHHLLNPSQGNLFQRVVLESGSPYSTFSADGRTEAIKKAYEVANAVSCTDTNVDSVFNCLREASPLKLVEASAKLGNAVSMYHAPVFDNKIIFDDRRLSVKALPKKEVLMGITSDDGAFLVIKLLEEMKINPKYLFEETAKGYFGVISKEVLRSIKYYYKDHCGRIKEYAEEIASAQMARDFNFLCSTTELLDDLSAAGFPTFMYQFNHRPIYGDLPSWVKADHGSEVFFLLGFVTPAEMELSSRMMNYWGCFAKRGDPNCQKQMDVTRNDAWNNLTTGKRVEMQTWPIYTKEAKGRIEIDLNSSTQEFGAIQADQCAFWNNDYPVLSQNISRK